MNLQVLSSFAYLSVSEDPLKVFTNFILCCMQKNGLGVNNFLQDIIKDVKKSFGVELPVSIAKMCIGQLKTRGIVMQRNGQFQLIKNEFNVDKFEDDCTTFEIVETDLIVDVSNFVTAFNVTWSKEETRQFLSNYILRSTDFFDNYFGTNSISKTDSISPDYYLCKYIEKQTNERTKFYDYLVMIIKGLMMYAAVYEIVETKQDEKQKFQGTKFFLDTKILLRALGYSYISEVKSANELVKIIRDSGGIICAFEHTVKEVDNAIYSAREQLKTNHIDDIELDQYAKINKYGVTNFEVDRLNLRDKIQIDFGIQIFGLLDWENEKTKKYTIDWKGLSDYISERQDWKKSSIAFDVDSINYINILRQGDYSIAFGGEKKLPIFVTSNIVLLNHVQNFFLGMSNNSPITNKWILPIITDNNLMFRLWYPQSKSSVDLPILTLSRYAYSAQQSTSIFYSQMITIIKDNKIKYKGKELEKLPEYALEKLSELAILNSGGRTENLSPELISSSFDELLRLELKEEKSLLNNEKLKITDQLVEQMKKNFELSEKLESLNSETKHKTIVIEKMNETHLNSLAEKYEKMIGTKAKLILWFIKMKLYIIVALSFLGSAISVFVTSNGIVIKLLIFFGLIASVVFEILLNNLLSAKKDSIKRIIEKQISRNLEKKITAFDSIYSQQIVEKVTSLSLEKSKHIFVTLQKQLLSKAGETNDNI